MASWAARAERSEQQTSVESKAEEGSDQTRRLQQRAGLTREICVGLQVLLQNSQSRCTTGNSQSTSRTGSYRRLGRQRRAGLSTHTSKSWQQGEQQLWPTTRKVTDGAHLTQLVIATLS